MKTRSLNLYNNLHHYISIKMMDLFNIYHKSVESNHIKSSSSSSYSGYSLIKCSISTLYLRKPPRPVNPFKNWVPSGDLSVTNSMSQPKSL